MFKLVDADGNEVEWNIDHVPADIRKQIEQKAQGLVYRNIDSKIEETFGVTKGEGEKTSEFVARIIKEKNEKIEELGKDSPDVAKLQGDIAKLKEVNNKLTNDLQEASKTYETSLNAEFLKSNLAGLIPSVPAHLTEEAEIAAYKEDQARLIQSKFSENYEIKKSADGSRKVFSKKDNSEVTSDNLTPLSISEIVKRDNPHLFKEVTPQTPPPGTPPGSSGKPSGSGGAKYKTFEDISAAAVKAGHDVGSKEFTDFVASAATEAGISY